MLPVGQPGIIVYISIESESDISTYIMYRKTFSIRCPTQTKYLPGKLNDHFEAFTESTSSNNTAVFVVVGSTHTIYSLHEEQIIWESTRGAYIYSIWD